MDISLRRLEVDVNLLPPIKHPTIPVPWDRKGRMEREAKAKIVASVWGAEFI